MADDTRLYDIDEEDYIPDDVLVKLGEHVDRMAPEFDFNHMSATQRSATVIFKFPGVADPFKQAELAELVAAGSTSVPTLYRNLVAARQALREQPRRDSDEITLDGHKVFAHRDGDDVVVDMVTDTRPLYRMRITTSRDEALAVAEVIHEAATSR